MTRIDNDGKNYGNYQPGDAGDVQGTQKKTGGPDTSNSSSHLGGTPGAGGTPSTQSIASPSQVQRSNFEALLNTDGGQRTVDFFLETIEFCHKVEQERHQKMNEMVSQTRMHVLQDAKDIAADEKLQRGAKLAFSLTKTFVTAVFEGASIGVSAGGIKSIDGKPNVPLANSVSGLGNAAGSVFGSIGEFVDSKHSSQQEMIKADQSFHQSILEDFRDTLRKSLDSADKMSSQGGDAATGFIKTVNSNVV